MICRFTKWNGSSPSLLATGELAASSRMIPASISAPSAASVSRSIVHHQTAKGVSCVREIMRAPEGSKSPVGV